MKCITLLQKPGYKLIALLGSVGILFLFPVIQTLPQGLHNLDVWFEVITPLNVILYFTFALLFGILLALQIYRWKHPHCRLRSATAGTVGTFTGVFIGQCASCLSITSLFLPVGVTTFLIQYNSFFMSLSIFMLIVGIYFLDGFKE